MSAITPNGAVTEVRQSGNRYDGRLRNVAWIVIHHWGEDGQTHDGVVAWLCRPSGTSSAHYVASEGRVTQLVSDRDTAWHCPGRNADGIGIECRPEMSAGDMETVAGLIAAIRSEWGHLPLTGHRDNYATECPGRWEARLAWLSARADEIGAGGGSATMTPALTVSTAGLTGRTRDKGIIGIDSWFGPATISKFQSVLGTPVDGVISGQTYALREFHVNAGDGWDYSDGGSTAVAGLQRRLGVEADGYLGPQTIAAWQARLGVAVDGYMGPVTVAAIQRALNGGGLW